MGRDNTFLVVGQGRVPIHQREMLVLVGGRFRSKMLALPKTKKISVMLDAPAKTIQLPSTDYMEVRAAKIRAIQYLNKGGEQVLQISMPQFNSGRNILASGAFQPRLAVMPLLPLDSTTILTNPDPNSWDVRFDYAEQVSRLEFLITLDGAPATAVGPLNQLYLELEFVLA